MVIQQNLYKLLSFPISMIQRTLVLIKPDGVQRGLVGEIIRRFERTGLKIVAIKMIYTDEKMAGKHYADDVTWLKSVGAKQKKSYEKRGIRVIESEENLGRLVRKRLIQYLTMSPLIAFVLEGHDAIEHVRKLVGPTAPSDALPGTIRGDFSFDTYHLADDSKRPIQNLIHASDSIETAEKEINLWFKKEEIHVWRRIDEDLLYKRFED